MPHPLPQFVPIINPIRQDNNLSLIHQVYTSYRKYALISLSTTYAALTIPTIISLIPPSSTHASNPTETETYIASLIASGSLSAILIPGATPSDPAILRFTSPNFAEDGQSSLEYEEQIEAMLAERTKEIELIARHMRATGETLEMSREYVEWLRKTKKGKEGVDGKGMPTEIAGMFPGGGTTGYDEDEDVMAEM